MERWSPSLADGRPDAGEALPHWLGYWMCEHDMAEAGEIIHASMVRAGMRIRKSSADVSEEGPDKKYAMRQAPCCDAALRSSAEECTAVHVWAQSSLPSCVSAGS